MAERLHDTEWITPKLTDMPEEGEPIEFLCVGIVRRGARRGNRFVSDSGEQWVHTTEFSRWRPLPGPPKPELPECVHEVILEFANRQQSNRMAVTAMLCDLFRPLFDTTKPRYLAVVESEPAVTNSVACLEREVELQRQEIRRLREPQTAEREAVERLMRVGTCLSNRLGDYSDAADVRDYWLTTIAAYRSLIQNKETSR